MAAHLGSPISLSHIPFPNIFFAFLSNILGMQPAPIGESSNSKKMRTNASILYMTPGFCAPRKLRMKRPLRHFTIFIIVIDIDISSFVQ